MTVLRFAFAHRVVRSNITIRFIIDTIIRFCRTTRFARTDVQKKRDRRVVNSTRTLATLRSVILLLTSEGCDACTRFAVYLSVTLVMQFRETRDRIMSNVSMMNRLVGGLDVRRAHRRRRRSRFKTRVRLRRRNADGYRVCLIFLSLASDQGGSPAEFKHISKRRKRN